jgi:tRNA(Ile)-lysidine synthase
MERSESRKTTLSRTVVDVRLGQVFLYREFRSLPEAMPLPEEITSDVPSLDRELLWDGRRRIKFCGGNDRLVIAPLGKKEALRLVATDDADDIPTSLKRSALAAEPALWRDEQCLGLIGENGTRQEISCHLVLAPWNLFLPSFDLAAARAVAALLCAKPLPEPPLIS